MNAKEMLDKTIKIIARTDVDRSLMLFFMNTTRRAVLRDNEIPKFTQYLLNVLVEVGVTGGVINTAAINVKSVETVEYDAGTKKTPLTKFSNYDSARYYYPDFTKPGIPRHYLLLGTKIYVLPLPITGTINLIAKVWPTDLTDSETSSDILTTEIPEAWIYLAVAEYFDYFDENDKGNYWRQKGSVLVQQYINESNYEDAAGEDNCVSSYYSNDCMRGDY